MHHTPRSHCNDPGCIAALALALLGTLCAALPGASRAAAPIVLTTEPTPTLPVVPLLPSIGVPLWAFVFAGVLLLLAVSVQAIFMSRRRKR